MADAPPQRSRLSARRHSLSRVRTAAAGAVLMTMSGLAATAAKAQPAPDDGPPVLVDPSDRDAATRLRPGADLTPEPPPGADSEPSPPPPTFEPAPEDEGDEAIGGYAVGVHARFAGLFDGILGSFFDAHPSLLTASAGLSLEIGHPKDGGQWIVSADWTGLSFPNQNWLRSGAPPVSAVYVEAGLQFISLDVSYRGHVFLNDWLSWTWAAGIGLGALAGNLTTDEVLPTCEAPIEDCPHWRQVTRKDVELPSPVWPVVHVSTGLAALVGDSAAVRLDLGFRNVFYVGLNASFRL